MELPIAGICGLLTAGFRASFVDLNWFGSRLLINVLFAVYTWLSLLFRPAVALPSGKRKWLVRPLRPFCEDETSPPSGKNYSWWVIAEEILPDIILDLAPPRRCPDYEGCLGNHCWNCYSYFFCNWDPVCSEPGTTKSVISWVSINCLIIPPLCLLERLIFGWP